MELDVVTFSPFIHEDRLSGCLGPLKALGSSGIKACLLGSPNSFKVHLRLSCFTPAEE